MPVLGDPSRFAIEYELEDDRRGPDVHLCLWAGGRRIGDFARVTPPEAMLSSLDAQLANAGKRTDWRFNWIATWMVWDMFDSLRDEELWDRHLLVFGVDAFVGWEMLVIENRDARVLFRHGDDYVDDDVTVEVGEIDTVLREARADLGAIHQFWTRNGSWRATAS